MLHTGSQASTSSKSCASIVVCCLPFVLRGCVVWLIRVVSDRCKIRVCHGFLCR